MAEMKKHSLIEHWNDVSMWWYETRLVNGRPYRAEDVEQRTFLIAYERWTNDKELLSIEDGYEFDSDYYPDPILDHPGRVVRVP